MHDSTSTTLSTTSPEAESASTQPLPRLEVTAAESFNYAAWQNSVPLLHSVVVDNSAGPELSSLTVELTASSGFVRAKRWNIDRIAAGERYRLGDTDLMVDPAYLDGLNEGERGVLTFKIVHQGNCLHEVNHVLRVLARDEWGGVSSMGELLPAFVTPNDPALASILRSAATVLERYGHPTALDGYQSRDPNRAYMLAAAIWSAVGGRALVYANPPASFERVGQKTRRVGTVLTDGLATCLDSTLLFASALEAVGLNPVLVLIEGHCFAGVWVVDKSFKRVVEPDCSELRKAIAARELVVFETTLVTHRPAGRFPDAVTVAARSISEDKEHQFVAVIDVGRARMAQILPLASHTARKEDVSSDELEPPPLPAPPGFAAAPAIVSNEHPTTPAGRIERWQRKLLDLSLRNRLLNFAPSKQTVPVLCPNLSQLEDRLGEGVRMRLISCEEANPISQRDVELYQRRTQKDLEEEFTRRAFEKNELVCPLEPRDLDARLTALFRKAKNDLSEGGSNTLYLAVGFLRWKQTPTDERTYRAPLLLVPVQLVRRSASSPFYLCSHEDEIRFNATLLQMLKKDFSCDLTALETDLPTDDSGVNVSLVFERLRYAVRDIPGFEVVEDAAIATFSFAKYLMWKDLVQRVGQLEQNRVVRHLIHDPDKPFASESRGSMPQAHEIDCRYRPQDIVHPLPADSSQLAAVMAAAEGHDMVIVGPPGTGKSQTIANLITQCLAVGKTVLFVAEKTAALDVVYRRLRKHGLGDCCIELHSNKAERRRFLDQLEASWTNRSQANAAEWITICEQLQVRRDELNAYAAAVHVEDTNGWTAYRAMGECIRGRDCVAPRLDWDSRTRHTREDFKKFEETIANLATIYQAAPVKDPIQRLEATDWSVAWENGMLQSCQELFEAAEALAAVIRTMSGRFGILPAGDVNAKQLSVLYRFAQDLANSGIPVPELVLHGAVDELARALQTRHELLQRSRAVHEALHAALQAFCAAIGHPQQDTLPDAKKQALLHVASELVRSQLPPAELVFHSQFDSLMERLSERPHLLQARANALSALVARSFNPALIDRVPSDLLERQWKAANETFWPLAVWLKWCLGQTFKAYMTPSGTPAPEIDLQLLREYRECCQRVAQNMASLGVSAQLQEVVDKDPAEFLQLLQAAQRMRTVLMGAGLSPVNVGIAAHGRWEPLVAAVQRLYTPVREIDSLTTQLKENLKSLGLSPKLQQVVEKDTNALSSQIEAANKFRAAVVTLGVSPAELAGFLQRLHTIDSEFRRSISVEYCRAAKKFQEAWVAYSRHAGITPVGSESQSIVADAAAQAKYVQSRRTALKQWTAWTAIRRRAVELGLGGFVDALQSGEMSPAVAQERFRLAYARWWLPTAIDRLEPLRKFQRFLHENAIEEFRRLDDLARKAATARARLAICHDLPPSDQVPRKSELGLLRHQMTLKRPSRSIREIIAAMPNSFAKLAPCLLMSPLSIAQYLPADQALFDVVVFDEASQIATWDAIGAIARGKQTIIVGDPKQLPPTNFFGKADTDDDNPELEDYEKDLESILDEAQASGLPTLQLNWHYRSKHESLIAFSNWNYYGNRLVTFPAAESIDRGVSLNYVQDGIYDRGKSRTNRREAEAIVADLVSRMKRCLRKPADKRLTYGVVTFNSQQQELIQDLLDEELRNHPELEWFFADDRIEPTVVKNLENVQGDERDVIMFSITFGFDAAGKFPVVFGALNSSDGERRLNVAVTRARQELVVYASFLPDQLCVERSSARGVHDLKAFLEYADKGPEAILARSEGSVGGYDSPFEEAIANALEKRGWRIDPQVGVSGFRIDLGVVHPNKPGAYLAGIECDGATYHRSAVARDRDKIRQQILEKLGWTILRVWSTDWWYDPDSALEQLHQKLCDLLEKSTKQTADPELPEEPENLVSVSEPDVSSEAKEIAQEAPECDDAGNGQLDDSAEVQGTQRRTPLFAKQSSLPKPRVYVRAALADASANQGRFFEASYSDTLRQMALTVLEVQGPIRDDMLVREVARAHGFGRMGERIKQRILELLTDIPTTTETVGTFLWPGHAVQNAVPFRYPRQDDERRALDEIAMPELIGLVREHPVLAASDDPALALAREIGLARLTQGARRRLEEAVSATEKLC